MSPKKKFKWSSHTPVLKTLIELCSPELIVELGVGHYSTPVFLSSSAESIIHIENNKEWLNLIGKEFQNSKRSRFVFHDLGNTIKNASHYDKLSNQTKIDLIEYYMKLKSEILSMPNQRKFLFVDHYTCARTVSINVLCDAFDAVAYHDAETPDAYNYQNLDKSLSEKFDHFVLKTPASWTGFFIKKQLVNTSLLNSTMDNHCEIFGKTFNIPSSEFTILQLT